MRVKATPHEATGRPRRTAALLAPKSYNDAESLLSPTSVDTDSFTSVPAAARQTSDEIKTEVEKESVQKKEHDDVEMTGTNRNDRKDGNGSDDTPYDEEVNTNKANKPGDLMVFTPQTEQTSAQTADAFVFGKPAVKQDNRAFTFRKDSVVEPFPSVTPSPYKYNLRTGSKTSPDVKGKGKEAQMNVVEKAPSSDEEDNDSSGTPVTRPVATSLKLKLKLPSTAASTTASATPRPAVASSSSANTAGSEMPITRSSKATPSARIASTSGASRPAATTTNTTSGSSTGIPHSTRASKIHDGMSNRPSPPLPSSFHLLSHTFHPTPSRPAPKSPRPSLTPNHRLDRRRPRRKAPSLAR